MDQLQSTAVLAISLSIVAGVTVGILIIIAVVNVHISISHDQYHVILAGFIDAVGVGASLMAAYLTTRLLCYGFVKAVTVPFTKLMRLLAIDVPEFYEFKSWGPTGRSPGGCGRSRPKSTTADRECLGGISAGGEGRGRQTGVMLTLITAGSIGPDKDSG